ncbi:MAG: hypothetical protein ACRD6N_06870, partial [Pyrinomonadaceae bacterium]
MRKGFPGFGIFIALVALIWVSGVIAQQTRNRPVAPKPPAGDLKIKYRSSTSGQTMESTTMLKGKRERSEMRMGYGMDTVNITQCDLKRTVQINEKSQKYIITPMDSGDLGQPAAAAGSGGQVASPVRRGGVVTYTTTATDTGERKEMFGFTARHVKTSVAIESSPDACNPVKQRMETDGWYIDLAFGLDCDLTRPLMANRPVPGGGCQDRSQFRRQGAARTGYALSETMTMYGADGKVTFTTSREVVELSREPLDASLFDVPAGYTEAANTQEFYGVPSMDAMMGQGVQGSQPSDTNDRPGAVETKRTGVVRVGVVNLNNKAGKPVPLDSLRERLVGNIESGGVEAVPLNAISQAEAEVEAKAKQCDFILYTDISGLKSSAAKKLGGMFGRAVGAGGIDKTEAKVDFRLFA